MKMKALMRKVNRFTKLVALVFLLFTASSTAFAQGGSVSSGGILVLSPLGRPIGGATVTVCAFGATGIPCSPTITVYTDPTLVTPALNPATSDGNGSVFVYAAPGTYTYSVTGTGITGKSFTATVSGSGGGNVINGGPASFTTLTVSGAVTMGNGNAFAPVTFSNHNNMCWAGPGALPTIDQAVTACTGFAGAIVAISPGYTGPESVNLFTNSLGYKTYTGDNHITVEDYRSNAGTPGNGFNAPMYGIVYGGRSAGALNRLGAHYYANSPNDSAAGANSFNWFSGQFPANSGQQAGQISVLAIHDAVTVGNTVPIVVGTDSELHADATSADNPLWRAWAYVGQILLSRTGAAQNIQTASGYYAQPCSNISLTAIINNCYGFDATAITGGANRNFSYHSSGDWATEYGTRWFAGDAGTPTFTIAGSPTGATEVNQTVTFTVTGGPCTYATGENVAVGGVTNTSYNNVYTVNSPGCNGTSTFTVYAPGTLNLAASGGGTVTRNNLRVTTTFGSGGNNLIKYQPLADTSGWRWQTQAGVDIVQITNTGLFATSLLGCTNNGTCDIGKGGTAPSSLYLFETTAPTAIGGQDVCYGDSTFHGIACNNNNAGLTGITKTVALTADWTCGTAGTVSSCVAATIIGSGGGVPLTVPLPLATGSYTLECDGVVGQATAATANQWNLLTATNGATNVTANYSMATAATASAFGAVTDQASTTTTFQIAPSWTLGGTATKMPFHIWAKIEGASASGTVVSLQLVAPTVADLVTIYRGAACRVF